jgi:hypothetical protein
MGFDQVLLVFIKIAQYCASSFIVAFTYHGSLVRLVMSAWLIALTSFETIVLSYIDAHPILNIIVSLFILIKAIHIFNLIHILGVDIFDIEVSGSRTPAPDTFRQFCLALRLVTSTYGLPAN